MKKEIQLLLQLTSQTYSAMIMELWLQWCSSKTTNVISLQKALISKPLFNWWKKELRALELQFLKDINPYSEVISKEVAKGMYDEYIQEIFKKISKQLIQNQK